MDWVAALSTAAGVAGGGGVVAVLYFYTVRQAIGRSQAVVDEIASEWRVPPESLVSILGTLPEGDRLHALKELLNSNEKQAKDALDQLEHARPELRDRREARAGIAKYAGFVGIALAVILGVSAFVRHSEQLRRSEAIARHAAWVAERDRILRENDLSMATYQTQHAQWVAETDRIASENELAQSVYETQRARWQNEVNRLRADYAAAVQKYQSELQRRRLQSITVTSDRGPNFRLDVARGSRLYFEIEPNARIRMRRDRPFGEDPLIFENARNGFVFVTTWQPNCENCDWYLKQSDVPSARVTIWLGGKPTEPVKPTLPPPPQAPQPKVDLPKEPQAPEPRPVPPEPPKPD